MNLNWWNKLSHFYLIGEFVSLFLGLLIMSLNIAFFVWVFPFIANTRW